MNTVILWQLITPVLILRRLIKEYMMQGNEKHNVFRCLYKNQSEKNAAVNCKKALLTINV